jgi:hypothetical protein
MAPVLGSDQTAFSPRACLCRGNLGALSDGIHISTTTGCQKVATNAVFVFPSLHLSVSIFLF